MSDELNAVLAKQNEPPADYVEMSDAYAPPKKDEKTFEGNDALQKAAREITEKRAEEPADIERKYIEYGTDRPMPENQTVSLDRASDDLKRQRGFEAVEAAHAANQATAFAVDTTRAGVVTPEQVAQYFEQQQTQPSQQPQSEAQPDPSPQPTSELPPEIAELQQELERSPRLKALLHAEAANIQAAQNGAVQAQQQYQQATMQATSFAIQSMLAAVPELQGVGLENLPAALNVLRQSNPEKYTAAVTHLARVDQLGKQAAAAQQQQAAQVNSQVQQWALAQDKAMDEYLAKNETPETVRAVKDNILKVANHYGISDGEFRQAIASQPQWRSLGMQKMLFDLVKMHTLRESVAEKISKPVPPVQRPGTSTPRSSYADGEVAAARERFLKNPDDPKSAAAYVMAKRAARS